MDIQIADRMGFFKPGIFAELARMKVEMETAGRKVIDFSIGSPNVPPALHIRQTMAEGVMRDSDYVYSLGDTKELRFAASHWYKNRYGIELDAGSEIVSLYGSQDGLAHFCLTFINPEDTVLVPNPYFPTFVTGPRLAGARIVFMPLCRENGFLIDFEQIPEPEARAAKLMLVSYPNNPTSAIAPDSFYRKLIAFAKKYDIMVLHDNVYSDLIFDGGKGKSFLSFEGAKDVGVELNSLSKQYGMAGARVGFCLGNSDICSAYKNLKGNIDLGSFLSIQRAAVATLMGNQDCVTEARRTYERRRDVLCKGLNRIGWNVESPKGTLFLWAQLPGEYKDSKAFVKDLLNRSGVLLAPGSAFGSMGEGYVRFSLVPDENLISQALDQIIISKML